MASKRGPRRASLRVVCKLCSALFRTTRVDAKYCSTRCRVAANRSARASSQQAPTGECQDPVCLREKEIYMTAIKVTAARVK